MRKSIVTALLAIQIAPAFANDSTAELTTGGLVFTKTPNIEMRSEDLYISENEIVVKYRFFNHSNANVSTLVAFPMPDIRDPGDGEDVAIPDLKDNFLDFQTRVDGHPVTTSLEQRTLVGETDYTGLLRQLSIPLLPYQEETNKALDRLPKEKWAEMISKGLASVDESDGTKHLGARWTLKSTYSWRQVFPSERELVIEHHYKPSVGGIVVTPLLLSDADTKEEIKKYCVDPDLLAALKKSAKPSQDPPFYERWISYILKTGANWAAPIADFRLVVDKGNEKNFVSFCGEGVRKISSTQFEMRKNNFLPEANLNVLILIPIKN